MLHDTITQIKNLQIPPAYYGFRKDSYVSLTKCTNCSRTSLYEDEHPVDPCPACGDKKKETVGRWIPPTYTGYWPFRTLVASGHWQLLKK